MTYQVSIVLVTHQSAQQIEHCLRSIGEQQGVSMQLIIADNVSTDGTSKAIDRFFATSPASISSATLVKQNLSMDDVSIIKEVKNLVKGERIFLLKPDFVFEKADELSRLLAYTESHPSIHMLGSEHYDLIAIKAFIREVYEDANKKCQRIGLWRFISPSRMQRWRESVSIRNEVAPYLGVAH